MTPATAQWALTVSGVTLFGLVIGSFLNVVIYRVPREMSVVRPPSHCPSCGTPLGALENLPLISWVALRAKCRHCHAPISPRYPLVELATGLVFFGLAWPPGVVRALPFLLVVAAAAIVAGGVAADGLAVPLPVAAVACVAAAALAAVAAVVGQPGRIGWAALGAVTATVTAMLCVGNRRSFPGRWRSLAVVVALGWSASWLWAPGGVILAGWIGATALSSRAWPASLRPAGVSILVILVAVGALALLVAGAIVTVAV
ncbi:MAG: prepilin peptidase [Acidimicrobiales bacterium]